MMNLTLTCEPVMVAVTKLLLNGSKAYASEIV
jgi:hypothetical protein